MAIEPNTPEWHRVRILAETKRIEALSELATGTARILSSYMIYVAAEKSKTNQRSSAENRSLSELRQLSDKTNAAFAESLEYFKKLGLVKNG